MDGHTAVSVAEYKMNEKDVALRDAENMMNYKDEAMVKALFAAFKSMTEEEAEEGDDIRLCGMSVTTRDNVRWVATLMAESRDAVEKRNMAVLEAQEAADAYTSISAAYERWCVDDTVAEFIIDVDEVVEVSAAAIKAVVGAAKALEDAYAAKKRET